MGMTYPPQAAGCGGSTPWAMLAWPRTGPSSSPSAIAAESNPAAMQTMSNASAGAPSALPMRQAPSCASSRSACMVRTSAPASHRASTTAGSTTSPSRIRSPPDDTGSPSCISDSSADSLTRAPSSKRSLAATLSKRPLSRSPASSCSAPRVMIASGVSER